MNSRSARALLFPAGLLTSLTLTLSGCASNKTSSASAAPASVAAATPNGATIAVPSDSTRPSAGSLAIATLQQDATETRAAVTRIAEALKRLQFAANPSESYRDLSEKIADYEKLSAKTQLNANGLYNNSQKLNAEWRHWAASNQDPAARAAAETRRVHLQDGYVYMLPTLVFAKNDLIQLDATVRTLKTALAPATTPAVLAANKALLENATHETAASIDSLRNFSDRLALVAPDLAPPLMFTGKRPRS